MPKPIAQRGFEVSKGDYGRYQVSYMIDDKGLENVSVCRGKDGIVSITVEDEVVRQVSYSCSQLGGSIHKSEINKLKAVIENFNENSLDKSDITKVLKEELIDILDEYVDSCQTQDFINSMTEYLFGNPNPPKLLKDIRERILNLEEKLKQASDIYFEVKKILGVDEELKNYQPRFSQESELTLFNIIGIDDVSQIKSFVEEKT